MNRLPAFADTSSTIQKQKSKLDPHKVSTLTRRSSKRIPLREIQPFATFAPQNYESGYAYPLIVWLHGKAGNEHQLRRVMPHVSLRNFVAVAPRGTVTRANGGYRWRQDLDNIEAAETRVFDCIAAASERFNVHSRRVFLVGVGCGGTMAARIGWNHPGKFAGVASIGGPLPTEHSPLRRINDARRVPLLVAMARSSPTYSEARVCSDLKLMHSAGCTVALRQYPGADDLTTAMLSDLNVWAMELVCGRDG
jgi:phospholipase/carboxylesterase